MAAVTEERKVAPFGSLSMFADVVLMAKVREARSVGLIPVARAPEVT